MGRNKIKLLSYNITYGDRYNNNRSDSIKVHYRGFFDNETNVKVNLSDYIFSIEGQHQNIKIKQDNYWSVFHSIGPHNINNDLQITNSFIEPLKLSFINFDTNEVINEYKLDIKFVDYSLRSRNTNKTNVWIIGDSHIGHIAKNINYNDLEYEKLRFNVVSKVGLTMSRFSNCKYFDYLSCLPIEDEDIIMFNLGEIDMRISTHVKSHNKNIDKIDILRDILFKYTTSIKKISEKYTNNKIMILRPNLQNDGKRDYTDNVIDDYFKHSNYEDRKILDNVFNETITSFCNVNKEIKYIDNSLQYGLDGFIDNELLINNDIHMKTNKQYFDSLYDKIKDL